MEYNNAYNLGLLLFFMDERDIRHERERRESFLLGFRFEKDVGSCESSYRLGREAGRYVSDAKLLVFSEEKVVDGNLQGFAGSFNDLRLFREKYAGCLSEENLEAVDKEIRYLEGISEKEKVGERLEKIFGDDL